ncbi:MAG: PorP/SprF family type IX secretion system membrane protein [Crocinitomicaceae bacterium]|nr:PorP/SprF family type IX secretion system membrane protein [Crocinitomicaceae bacterium]
MKRIYITLMSLGLLVNANAQDFHFAQSSQTPLFINPAAAGVFDGWERITINHRNQWLGASTQFMTTAIGADINLFKSDYNPKAHMGVGLMFFNDVGGDSRFGNQTGALTISGIIPLGAGGHILSVGVQGALGSRKADLSNVTFMTQWDNSTSTFNPLIASGENNGLTSFMYMDVSAGIYYTFDGGKNSFARDNDFKLKIGVAGFHLNMPELQYVSGSADRLYRKYVAHVGFSTDFSGRPLAMEANAIQFIQGGHYETLFGLMMKYRFESATKITGNNQDAFVGLGLSMRWGDAIIPAVSVEWKGFQLGISYDITISELRKAYGGGSLEFSLAYTNLDHSLFKVKRRKF